MNQPYSLFEVSWEVCNKTTGINTVLATKARATVDRLGDDYVAVGPWLLADTDREIPFVEDTSLSGFCEACRAAGTPIRIGRWQVPGTPRTVLVEFSGLYDRKDEILTSLWDDFGVDSIAGQWDYVEPVLFGWAVGQVLEKWWEEYLAPEHRRAVVHTHEWRAAASLLYLKQHLPAAGTVFTSHGTVLGRALAAAAETPLDGLPEGRTTRELAEQHEVVAKHSLEGVAVREADVLTTVSATTAQELERVHERPEARVLACGVDLDAIVEVAADADRTEVRQDVLHLASRFLGDDVSDAALVATASRYEFHNKGLDLLLEALAQLNGQEGRRIVAFLFVPAPNSGVRADVQERLAAGDPPGGSAGLCTHHLFDEDNDAIRARCAQLGLDNDRHARVRIIHVPAFIGRDDGLLGRPYEAVLGAMHSTCFPAYYEPWGLAPQESLAVGVPTVTTDYSGFGRWAEERGFDKSRGIMVLKRHCVPFPQAVSALATHLQEVLAGPLDDPAQEAQCRETAQHFAWADLVKGYAESWEQAVGAVDARSRAGVTHKRRPRRPLAVRPLEDGRTPRLTPFWVAATLPEPLQALRELARNFWWCWNSEVEALFEDLSPRAWRECAHNPVALLQRAFAEDLTARAADPDYLRRLGEAHARFQDYMKPKTEAPKPPNPAHPIAYFSAEFGLHESLPIYSGGLGLLAGDHLKSASDLAVPLIAVGLFYRMGYMAQRLTADGEQLADDIENDPRVLATRPVTRADGSRLEFGVRLPGRELRLRAWRVDVGRVVLYLLDADVPSNRPEDRDITRNLYGGGGEMRIQQEIVLGRGGVRMLAQLEVQPSVYHMNEGHAAFLTVERVARLVREGGLSFDAAREFVRGTTLFTTHTPVPAGHDRFSEDLMRRYFSDAADLLGVSWERFYAFGSVGEENGEFNMTKLALSFSSFCNGVSKLHGAVSRKLLSAYWPGMLEAEVPITSITNGVHLPTWTHPRIAALLRPGAGKRGASPATPVDGAAFRDHGGTVDRKALWDVRSALKSDLLAVLRDRLQRNFLLRGDSPRVLEGVVAGLDERALVIGFARRFAPYKRAHLLFSDPDRLHAILSDADRPVRVVIAGKAHPKDTKGQEILKDLAARTRDPKFRGMVIFAENYDIALARHLVRGVDVWLNNPLRPMEASGTSGMKAAANGGLNLSIGDGWWPEACDGENGWLFGDAHDYEDQDLQDQLDSGELYRLLEEEVVPLYFRRDRNDVPREWLDRVAHAFATVAPQFNTDRMVGEYDERAYRPIGRAWGELGTGQYRAAKAIAQDQQRIRRAFPGIKFVSAQVADLSHFRVGESLDVRAEVDLGELHPEDVVVELVVGHAKGEHDLQNMQVVTLSPLRSDGALCAFEGTHTIERSGHYGHGLRVRPRGDEHTTMSLSDLVVWA
ncbi:MAG: alpha-glucan family phosphorylase [Planctomycetota bacterium]